MLLIIFLISSCAMHHYGLPPSGNTQWEPKADSAVILIGIQADKWLQDISGVSEGSNTIASALYPPNAENMIAIHRKVGESFQLENVYYSGNLNYIPYIKFDNLPVLKINKPGLYYYGAITDIGGKSTFSKDAKRESDLNRARGTHRYLFNTMMPVNF